jgi:hypothetical protein
MKKSEEMILALAAQEKNISTVMGRRLKSLP